MFDYSIYDPSPKKEGVEGIVSNTAIFSPIYRDIAEAFAYVIRANIPDDFSSNENINRIIVLTFQEVLKTDKQLIGALRTYVKDYLTNGGEMFDDGYENQFNQDAIAVAKQNLYLFISMYLEPTSFKAFIGDILEQNLKLFSPKNKYQ